ncbi:MAG: hypothetical protein KBC64_00720 [Simkaniaceae bacterium]|nr:hypothetical protein [Simkaniaceae bacterium]
MSLVNGPAFIPSSSPYFDKHPSISPEIGGDLFNHTSQFYAWYLSWERAPTEHKETFSLLSTIMQVAKVSLEGGLYLNKEREREGVLKLQDLSEGLTNGSYASHEISETVSSILMNLIDNNPKARLVAKSTLLEYKLLIYNNKQDLPRDVFVYLTSKITPSLGDLDAEKLSRELSKLLDSSQEPEEILGNLTALLNHWP